MASLMKEATKALKKKLSEKDEGRQDWCVFRQNDSITVIKEAGRIGNPIILSWNDSSLLQEIKETIKRLGYQRPTPLQTQVIRLGLQNRDVVGVVATNSDKNLAFLVPFLTWIQSLPEIERHKDCYKGPFAVVLTSTCLSAQKFEIEINKFCQRLGIRVLSVIGRLSRQEQKFRLQMGCEIVVSTPGHLLDALNLRHLLLERCSFVVLDEADRMLKLRFGTELREIFYFLPETNEKPNSEDAKNEEKMMKRFASKEKYRQTIMFTTMMPPEVEQLATFYLRRPAVVYTFSSLY